MPRRAENGNGIVTRPIRAVFSVLKNCAEVPPASLSIRGFEKLSEPSSTTSC